MSKPIKLRRLLSRKQVEPWLGGFKDLDNSLSTAVIDSNGRLFVQSGSWEEQRLAHHLVISPAEDSESLALVEGVLHFP